NCHPPGKARRWSDEKNRILDCQQSLGSPFGLNRFVVILASPGELVAPARKSPPRPSSLPRAALRQAALRRKRSRAGLLDLCLDRDHVMHGDGRRACSPEYRAEQRPAPPELELPASGRRRR